MARRPPTTAEPLDGRTPPPPPVRYRGPAPQVVVAVVVVVSVVGGAAAILVRHLARSEPAPGDAVRTFFEALRVGDCEEAGDQLTDQSLRWLAEELGPGELDDEAGHALFVQQCEETIAAEQEGVEVISTEKLSEHRLFATVRVVVRRPGEAEQSFEIDLVDDNILHWQVDLSSLGEALDMPELATIRPDPGEPSDGPRTPIVIRPPRRR